MRFRRPRGDGGSIIPLVPGVALALLLIGGLIVDGSRDLNARGEAQAFAEEAARAGASAYRLDRTSLTLDYALAASRVQDYCDTVRQQHSSLEVVSCGLKGSTLQQQFTTDTTCNNRVRRIVVNTEVTLRIHTTLLGIVHIQTLDASGAAKARPYEGLTAADAC
jgi:Flp pilus assembly protein TadG